MASFRLAEEKKIVPVANGLDVSSAAANKFDSINMKNFHRATFICQIHTMAGAAWYLNVTSGATDGTQTSQLAFTYALSSAATGSASCDVLGTTTSVAAGSKLTLAHATYDNYMLIVEVDAADMDIANAEEWLTLSIDDDATGATGTITACAILEPRYTAGSSATALA